MKCINKITMVKCEFNNGGFCKKYSKWGSAAWESCFLNDNAVGAADKLKAEGK
ncbi:hypothetical protein [Clostridium sp.]|uniref:hypothetical protein n=1 Tax=Clostridium sp. TaxID=1506 RepID=UPI002FCAF383